jgi:hypothetical protein
MRKFLFRITLAVSLAACALSLSGGPLGPKAALAASPALDAAQQLYDGAKFNDAITKLREAITTGAVSGPDALKAKELLGRCLVKTGSRIEAREQFKNLLRQDGGYRLDAAAVPPDEMEVFELARKAIVAEQIDAGQRIPASLSFYYGKGPGDNKSLGEVALDFTGGKSTLDVKPEFGGSVRFPLRPRYSLDLELSRLRATSHDQTPAPNDTRFEAAAIPLVVSLYWTAMPGAKFRANAFVGAGPMLVASNSIDLPFGVRIKIADAKTGLFVHTGLEGEYLVHSKVSLTGRVLYRSATATNLYHDSPLNFGTHPVKDRKVDFSGVAFAIGMRAYIGY